MPQETETVTGNPEGGQQNNDAQKQSVGGSENGEQLVQVSPDNDTQPSVQEAACVLKQSVQSAASVSPQEKKSPPKSPVAEATEEFLQNEKGAYVSEPPMPEPRTPVNSEASESGIHPANEEPVTTAPQVVEVSIYSENIVVETPAEEPVTLNGASFEEQLAVHSESDAPAPLTNGQSNGECKFELKTAVEPEPELISNDDDKHQIVNGTVANELITENYKLPDVVEVKKNFEYIQPAGHNVAQAPPKKGALSTSLDSKSVRQAYQDVRHDGSDTQWAVFKFEGPTIVTSATGADFAQFKKQFSDDERAFGYIRVQTGDEMSRRAKFIFLTWVGPSVSVLKRAKMSTDKALIKDILSNFAVELQTENIGDINLQNFEAELDKAAGAHYGTGIRS